MKIFISDDDAFCLNLYHQQVMLLGYKNVSLFSNTRECLMALETMPDVVFLDHNLDPMHGIAVLKQIKQFNPAIYVVFISALEDSDIALQSLKHGAFDYIIKGKNELEAIRKVLLRINEIQVFFGKKLSEAV